MATNTIIDAGKRITSASGKRFFNKRKRAELIVPIALCSARKMVIPTEANVARNEVKYLAKGLGFDARCVFLEVSGGTAALGGGS